ncbi:hypothetical protein IMZ11_02540 [Microtetraspora sp. AC03309]|uniref:hypothetical protein n=1 Tax=Microtetraspora sp. AC03309 TaxID=2779376 RepID=UPI001E47A219|nr:hypothetical protein [Microtetraspora sp. AC03309]MCC5574517.1 hypothetical protein [Microtetraspora sp. AC03309]
MKMRVTVVGEYDLTDDLADRERDYGTTDLYECAKIDENNPVIDLIQFADRIVRREVRPALDEQHAASLEDFARWIVSLDDPDGPGFEARKSVTMALIIRKAREALNLPEEV